MYQKHNLYHNFSFVESRFSFIKSLFIYCQHKEIKKKEKKKNERYNIDKHYLREKNQN